MFKYLYFIYICICLIGQRIFVLCQFLFSFWCFHNGKVLTLLFLGNCMKQVSEKMFWNSPRKYFFNMSDCTFLIAYYWLNSWNTRGYLTSKVRTPKLCYIHIYHIIKTRKLFIALNIFQMVENDPACVTTHSNNRLWIHWIPRNFHHYLLPSFHHT